MARCIHCLAPLTPPDEVCESCLDLLSDLGDDLVVEPPPTPASGRGPAAPVSHTGRFEPSQADVQAYCDMSERGAFRPFDQVRPKQLPSHARNRWGKAIASTSRRDPDVPKQ